MTLSSAFAANGEELNVFVDGIGPVGDSVATEDVEQDEDDGNVFVPDARCGAGWL